MGCQEEIPCILASCFSHFIPVVRTALAVRFQFQRELANG
jgi:hypothetical protein